MNENGAMKSKIEAAEHALDMFMRRNPNWILTAGKEDYRQLTVALLTVFGKLNEAQE